MPASRYQVSLRSFPETLPPIEYDPGVTVRKVQQKGEISFRGKTMKVGQAFHGHPIGLQATAIDGVFARSATSVSGGARRFQGHGTLPPAAIEFRVPWLLWPSEAERRLQSLW